MATLSETILQTRLRLYRMMYLIRRAEELLMAEYHPADEMRCPMHFCVGQEAMPAALAGVLRRTDVLMSHYRSHGYYLAKGAPLDAMVAEFYGKATGANSGVAGSMELGSHDFNFYSGAIVGGSLFIPLGAAFSQKFRGVDDMSVSVIGDGVFDEGITYEVFNLAALHRLPLLIICENNKYAAHTSLERRQAVTLLAERAKVFGLPIDKLDGNDVELLLHTLERVVPQIRTGKGPHFIEIETYRFCGHVGPGTDESMGYRSADEVERWKARDPVLAMRKQLAGALDRDELERLEREVDTEVHAAIAAAKRADFADIRAILANNWSGEYASVVDRFTSDVRPIFKGGQSEARPGPF
ncbi:MAG: thiamine pyrophosphate-dependent dehydrogenase E1 component subunit alpha [Xanthobacteraceae bacterium]